MTAPRRPPRTPGPIHVAVSAVVLVVFARAVPFPLHADWDDGRFIIDNALAHQVSWRALRAIFAAPHFEAYHPLHLLSYWLDVPWAGANGPVLHAVSLGLWAIAANLLLRVFVGWGLSVPAAALATFACALHPIQVEAVSWATGRKDVLALLFSCMAVLLHLRSNRWLDRWAWLSRASFLCAVLAKTTALPLPAVLWLADVLLHRRSARDALRQQAPALVLGAAIAAGVIAIWTRNEMIRGGADAATFGALGARVARTFAHQLGTALWPSATSPMYSTQAAPAGAGAWLTVAGAVLAVVAAHRAGARRALFALGAFLLWLAPVSNIVPMYFPLQDRYLSLPLIGLAFGCGALLDRWRARPGSDARLPVLAGALIVFVLALRCVQYQGEWQDQTRLWGHAASTQPDAYYAFLKLGEVRAKTGDLHGAIRAYSQLLRIDPRRKLGHAALLRAVALRDERIRGLRPSQADALSREYYMQLDDAEALRALAGRMLRSGHLRALELPMHRALELQPVADSALERAAATHFAQGRPTVGLFYLGHMQQPTQHRELQALAARARALLAGAPL